MNGPRCDPPGRARGVGDGGREGLREPAAMCLGAREDWGGG